MIKAFILLSGVLFFAGCNSVLKEKQQLAYDITNNKNFKLVKEEAKTIIGSGFTAGDGYGEIWIRDFNTFIELSCDVLDRKTMREKLLVFFKFQGADGNIIDAYIPKNKTTEGTYQYIYSELEPDLAAHKNTVETDQESSLLQAVFKYIKKTDDKEILQEEISGMKVFARMERALEFLTNYRFNEKYGLIWGGTTADWGDVQPEHEWGVFLTETSHYSIDIYDNAMLVIAIKNFIDLVPESGLKWTPILKRFEISIRKYLWDQSRMKFRPHIYITDSPFPENLKEDEIFYHGGTAVAIETIKLHIQ